MGVEHADVRAQLLVAIRDWTDDPRRSTVAQSAGRGATRDRLASAARQLPEQRGSLPFSEMRPRTVGEPGWTVPAGAEARPRQSPQRHSLVEAPFR